ncbi:MAG: VanW family protein [Candidatus Falkowbacteria bacterium]
MISPRTKRTLFLSLTIFSAFAVLILGAYLVSAKVYDNKIYPGVIVDSLDLGGLSFSDAEKKVKEKSDSLISQELQFVYKDRTANVASTKSSFDMDLSTFIWDFDSDATIKKAYSFGRSDNFWVNIWSQIKLRFVPEKINFVYRLNEDGVREELRSKFSDMETPVKNAELKLTSSDSNSFVFNVQEAKMGVLLDYEQAISDLKGNLANGEIKPITLISKQEEANILSGDAGDFQAQADSILALAPLTLEYKASSSAPVFKSEINKAKLASILGLERNGHVRVSVSSELGGKFLEETVAPKINKEPAKARFEIQGGKVDNFQVSSDGLKLNIAESIKKIKEQLDNRATSTIALVVDVVTEDKLSVESINDLGIKEIIGTGHSNFAGSPANRRHNIAVGAAAVNGLLIKPGEEFSLVKTLGDIDASTGYLPELVIKENKTIPEYGGGLCQVGTTVFRAALQSGLPITARRNHSYRVAYYEPAGTDAAIYVPNPDVRFVNDTANYVLIQSRIVGNDFYFDFWGVKDNRQVSLSKPVVYNIVKPAPTKIVETTDLAPGKKKCTEKAHNGADAYFDYKVVYSPGTADEKKEEKRFSSHYVPWQEVCLVGVAKPTTPVATSTAPVSTSTAPVQ